MIDRYMRIPSDLPKADGKPTDVDAVAGRDITM